MNNSGLIEYKESFITKIKKFLKKFLRKKEEQYNYVHEQPTNKVNQEENKTKNDFTYDIKVDTKAINTVIERNNFLKEIEGNEEVLNKLSIDRLKKLEKYYDNIIEQNNKKIKKLKENLQ